MVSDMNIFVWKLSKIAAQFFFFSRTFFTFEVPFNGLFAPTSQSRMSNIFIDLEFLGENNGKKWSNIWRYLFESGLKSPRKFFFADFALVHGSTLLWHRCYYPHRLRDALSPVCGIFLYKSAKYLSAFLGDIQGKITATFSWQNHKLWFS